MFLHDHRAMPMADIRLSLFSILMVLTQRAVTVGAHPMDPLPLDTRDVVDVKPQIDGQPIDRVAVAVSCVLLAFILAFVQGYRAGRMAGHKSKTQVSHILVFVQGFFCTAFLMAVAVVAGGLGLHTLSECRAAAHICIALFASAKVALYLFLLERVHIVRASFVSRWRDPIYVIGGIVTTGSLLGLFGSQLANPYFEMSPRDGKCRIGLHSPVAILITINDVLVNVVLTGIFIWQLRPAWASTRSQIHSTVSSVDGAKYSAAGGFRYWLQMCYRGIRGSSLSELQVMLVRNVISAICMLVSSLSINIFTAVHDFARRGHVCLLICLSDVVLGMLVTNWLTMRSAKHENSSRPTCSTVDAWSSPASSSNSAISRGPSQNSDGKPIRINAFGVPVVSPVGPAMVKNEYPSVP